MAVKKGVKLDNRYYPLARALVVSNLVSLLLFGLRSVESLTDRYWFLLWNLLLGWLPVIFACLLINNLKKQAWSQWKNVVLSLLWLVFLPNSFYLLSDLIHIHQTGEVSLLYDIVMFYSFVFNGFIAGYISLYVVHKQILRVIPGRKLIAHSLVGLVLLLCSFAIYLGRSLRWNTWDILFHPTGLIFDVSDRVINPAVHPQAFITTSIFFLLLASIYLVLWESIELVRRTNQ